jgi:PRTRC genetic system protein F
MLQLPQIDTGIPLHLQPRASRQRGARLVQAVLEAGLVREEHVPRSLNNGCVRVAESALHTWLNESVGTLHHLRLRFVMAVGPQEVVDTFGSQAERRGEGAVVEWSCEGRAFPVGPELERLERVLPRLGMTVLSALEEAAWRTVPMYSPMMILEVASRVYWCGDEDERDAIAMSCETADEARDMAASMVTRRLVDDAYPAWALRRPRRLRDLGTRTLRRCLSTIQDQRARAAIQDVIALRETPLPKRDWTDREGDFVGFAGALTWGEKDDLTFRVIDDFEQQASESGEYFEDCGRAILDSVGAEALAAWMNSMRPWFNAVRLIDGLLSKLCEGT